MKLIIAEKNSLAKAAAEALGHMESAEGGYYCGLNREYFALPASGHLLRLPDFEEYGVPEGEVRDNGLKRWKASTLPVLPPDLLHPDWRFSDERCQKLYTNISGKLKQAESVFHMGDFDREGQLIVDNILHRAKYTGKVYRILPKSVTQAFLQEHFKKPEDNADYATWADAAMARAIADQLFGLNLSRAFTIAAQRQGKDVLLTYGRVMTPTLNLVVMRDRLIEKFKPEIFFVPFATFQHEKGNFTAKWVKPDDFEGLSPEGNLTSIEERNKIIAAMKDASGTISESGPKKRIEHPPLPYSLPDMQKDAFNMFGLKVDKTLEVMQELYEQKLLTYPRTDSNYLHDTQFAEAPAILDALTKFGLTYLKGTLTQNRHRAFDSKKITAHTAIIPTGEDPSSLTGVHKKVYDLAVLAYWRLFLPDRIYEEEIIRVKAGGFEWQTKSARELDPGWTITGGGVSLTDNALPQGMKVQDPVSCIMADFTEGKTTPPKHFTQASLLEAMRSIHKYESNPAFKVLLKETSGLGTPATQADTITKLAERGYVKTEKDAYISTPVARQFIDSIPEELRSPGLTALWEDDFKEVMAGTLSLETFLQKIVTRLPGYCEQALSSLVILGKNSGETCPNCGKICLRKKKKGSETYYWTCLWCDTAFADAEGKPGQAFGGERLTAPCVMRGCTGIMTQYKTKDGGRIFWKCAACETFAGGDTTPDVPMPCPACQGQVVRKTFLNEKKELRAWWTCLQCEASFEDDNGTMGVQREAVPSKPCPLCVDGTIRRGKTKDDRVFWYCKNCKTYLNEKNGELMSPAPCPACGKPALWGMSKSGTEYWKCTACEVFFRNENNAPVPNDPGQPCPFKDCKGSITRHIAKASGKPFWVCDTCKKFLNEQVEGVPLPPVACPSCGGEATWGKKDDRSFWKCQACGTFFDDVNGVPVAGASSGTGKKRPCPFKNCKGQMVQNKSKEGGFYWRCTACKQYLNEFNGSVLMPVPCIEKKCTGLIVGGVSKKGNVFWKCNKCGAFFEDVNGKPGKKQEKR